MQGWQETLGTVCWTHKSWTGCRMLSDGWMIILTDTSANSQVNQFFSRYTQALKVYHYWCESFPAQRGMISGITAAEFDRYQPHFTLVRCLFVWVKDRAAAEYCGPAPAQVAVLTQNCAESAVAVTIAEVSSTLCSNHPNNRIWIKQTPVQNSSKVVIESSRSWLFIHFFMVGSETGTPPRLKRADWPCIVEINLKSAGKPNVCLMAKPWFPVMW